MDNIDTMNDPIKVREAQNKLRRMGKIPEYNLIRWEIYTSIKLGYVKDRKLYAFDMWPVERKIKNTTYASFLWSIRDKLTGDDQIVYFKTAEECKEWAQNIYRKYQQEQED